MAQFECTMIRIDYSFLLRSCPLITVDAISDEMDSRDERPAFCQRK